MSSTHNMRLAVMTVHDYLFFASRDYGSVARPAPVINNYALMYAINRHTVEVRRTVSGTVPNYDTDLPLMRTYATAASLVTVPRAGLKKIPRTARVGDQDLPVTEGTQLTMQTWNSIGELLLDIMTQEPVNIPKVGAYHKYPPLTTFYFYVVGDYVPSVVRIGKKGGQARVVTYPLDNVRLERGVFRPSCPVTIIDLPGDTVIRHGSLLTVPPTPLLLNAELDGEYLEGTDTKGQKHRIPVPSKERFAAAWAE